MRPEHAGGPACIHCLLLFALTLQHKSAWVYGSKGGGLMLTFWVIFHQVILLAKAQPSTCSVSSMLPHIKLPVATAENIPKMFII